MLREPQVTGARLDALCEAAAAAGLAVRVHDRHPEARSRPEPLHLAATGEPPVHREFGQSCHSPAELDRAFARGASYALLSPVFPPTSKGHDTRTPLGPERFVTWAAGRPVYALGGITPANAGSLRAAGAPGVAVLGAVFGQPTPTDGAKMVTTLLAAWSGRL